MGGRTNLRWAVAAWAIIAGATQAVVASELSLQALVRQFCSDCHGQAEKAGGLDLAAASADDFAANTALWEKVARKLRARQMPPVEATRPDEATYQEVTGSLEAALDRLASLNPRPGRVGTFRRLTRAEFQNAIRDLLNIQIDAQDMLPADEASHGFDNITVENLSPTLLDRYISAAQKISRLAVGTGRKRPDGDTFRIRPDITQEEHVAGLPLGTRGGAAFPYTVPIAGEYEIQVRLARDRNEVVEGLSQAHQLVVLVNRGEVAAFTVEPPADRTDYSQVDQHLKVRTVLPAGLQSIGVTFLKNPSALLESKRQPYQAHFNFHRHPRISPAVYQVSITGPFAMENSMPMEAAATTSAVIWGRMPPPFGPGPEESFARQLLADLARQAFRRPVTDPDLAQPMRLYQETRTAGGFEPALETAIASILVSPQFLFRIERDPPDQPAHSAYPITDLELASRLSFFLWSSLPDDELLRQAEAGRLRDPQILRQQTRRMLASAKSDSLTRIFANQWLHLRNLESITPDLREFPDFDHNLREALGRETELLFATVVREDRSLLDLLRPGTTYLNERLAKHYDVPHIYGDRFRRVTLDGELARGGLLRQGSILTVTSYATRTSPVIRGKWVLENLLGTPPPPPPPNVPALQDNTVAAKLTVRERLAEHRANAACASCHNFMDPVGLALENYDAIGRFRATEEGRPIDASGGLPNGSQFTGVSGLEQALLARPDLFALTMAEKLLTFALGRGIGHDDGPAIRRIVADCQAVDYRFSSLIEGIVASVPFQMRTTE